MSLLEHRQLNRRDISPLSAQRDPHKAKQEGNNGEMTQAVKWTCLSVKYTLNEKFKALSLFLTSELAILFLNPKPIMSAITPHQSISVQKDSKARCEADRSYSKRPFFPVSATSLLD